MDRITDWMQRATTAIFGTQGDLLQFGLRVLGALLLLVAGWWVAVLCRRIALGLMQGAGRIGRRVSGISQASDARFGEAVTRVLAAVVFWGVFVLFVAASGRLLDLAIVDRAVEALARFVPSLVVAFIIVVAGVIAAGLADAVVARAAAAAGVRQSALLGRITRVAVLITTAVIASTQVGLDVSFVTSAALVALGAVAGALALGLGLATPIHVSNLIGARNVRRLLEIGDNVALGDQRGTVVRINSTHVIVAGDDGDIAIPARLFAEKPFTRTIQESGDARD